MITRSNIVEFFEQYKRNLKRKPLPIIALTANVFAEDSERALRAGMDARRPHGQARGGAAASGNDDALDRIARRQEALE